MKNGPLHPRAYAVTVAWTLLLLLLGSVVHATESSLACPDWPTCFGTMLPEMEGGVFWEHLHRLVAGGLILMFALATWLVRSEAPARSGLFRLSLAGLGLLLVQAVFGGVTVLLRLPAWVSTTHLGLALVFLGLATALAVLTSPSLARRGPLAPAEGAELTRWGWPVAGLVLVQSLLGGVVRHLDAGLACPDVPTCLGSWVPPLGHPLVTLHFAHRAFGVLTLAAVLVASWRFLRSDVRPVRRGALALAGLACLQVALGFLSVTSGLAVAPVSMHTLVAATLLVVAVALSAAGAMPAREHGTAPGEALASPPAAALD